MNGFTSVGSLMNCAVVSTGLRGAQIGSILSIRAWADAGISGIGTPYSSAASETITPAPPLTVITPSVLSAGNTPRVASRTTSSMASVV
ncbi:hypothetical protein D3C81_896230 [compost metagenome]